MQRKIVETRHVAALALVAIMASGCASANRTPDQIVDHIAGYGAQAAKIQEDAQTLIEKATPSVIPADTTAKIQVELRNAAQIGLKLTSALEVFDAFNPNDVAGRTQQIVNINRLLDELRRYTRVVLVFVGQNAVGDQLLTMYDNLDKLYSEIVAGMDKWQASVAK